MKNLVIYHRDCADGWTAAWVAAMSLGGADRVELHAARYGDDPPDVNDRDVYIVDFSYPRATLVKMAAAAEQVTLIDHHRTAAQDLTSLQVAHILLANGEYAIIDTEDVDRVSRLTWAKGADAVAAYLGGGRAASKYIYLHRYLLKVDDPNVLVDHVNRNVLDNRKSNLRIATKQENAANMDRGSKWKGVTHSRNKWKAQITVDGQCRHLGVFESPEEAARAYDDAAQAAFGPYARGNFFHPPEPPPLPPKNLTIKFDMGRSGAALAWDHFFPGKPRPWLVEYVQDRDLWLWRLPDSRAVSAYLGTLEYTIESWNLLLGDEVPDYVIEAGNAVLAYQGQSVRRTCERARPGRLHALPCVIVNCTSEISEVGNALALTHTFAAMWFQDDTGGYVYSLRSSANNPAHVDVSAIAKLFGGGGHKHAAGFRVLEPVHSFA